MNSLATPHGARRSYRFPNATLAVYPDRTCREFPAWCGHIHADRSRDYTASALRQLRKFKRAV